MKPEPMPPRPVRVKVITPADEDPHIITLLAIPRLGEVIEIGYDDPWRVDEIALTTGRCAATLRVSPCTAE